MKNSWLWIACVAAFAIGCSSTDNSNAASTSTSSGTPTSSTETTGGATGTTGSTSSSTTATTGYPAVQAIFTQSCVGCHGGARPKGGINLTSYDDVMKGGEEGPIVTAGDPDKSKLVDALRGRNGAMQMPKGGKPLSEDQIKTIEDWIKAGAKNG